MGKTSEVRMEKNLSEETHWEKAAKTRMGKYLTRTETDFIFKSINPSQIHTVMDVGAEAGRFSLLAANEKATVIGIDVDSYGLKRLKLKNQHVNIIQADARKIPLKDEIFDAIIMIEVLDYIAELDEALTECYRTLKSNAPLLLSFGNKSSLKSKLRIPRKILQAFLQKSYAVPVQNRVRSDKENGIQLVAFWQNIRKSIGAFFG